MPGLEAEAEGGLLANSREDAVVETRYFWQMISLLTQNTLASQFDWSKSYSFFLLSWHKSLLSILVVICNIRTGQGITIRILCQLWQSWASAVPYHSHIWGSTIISSFSMIWPCIFPSSSATYLHLLLFPRAGSILWTISCNLLNCVHFYRWEFYKDISKHVGLFCRKKISLAFLLWNF